jgi:hypothetical protein
MNYSTVVRALAIGLTIPLATGSAQSDPVEPNKWSLSLGVDPTDFDLRTRDPGVHVRAVGNLTRTWQSPGSRFGRHISLMQQILHAFDARTIDRGIYPLNFGFRF